MINCKLKESIVPYSIAGIRAALIVALGLGSQAVLEGRKSQADTIQECIERESETYRRALVNALTPERNYDPEQILEQVKKLEFRHYNRQSKLIKGLRSLQ